MLKVRNLSLGYQGITLFQDLSLEIQRGTITGVLGANGSGKSTFIKALLGLIKPLHGDLVWEERPPKTIGYLAQMSEFDRTFPLRVCDLAAMGAWQGDFWSRGSTGNRSQVLTALKDTGIKHLADSPIHRLSGGELQRALFARVIVQDAPLILLDEPFSAIDQSTEQLLLTLINRWRQQGRAVVLVLHDLSSVVEHCDEVVLFGQGHAVQGNARTILTTERLISHGYLSANQAEWLLQSSQDSRGRRSA